MTLTAIDWGVIALYFVAPAIVGLWYARRASSSTEEFFLSGRTMPWWLAGTSMVATTFAADTPLAAMLLTNAVESVPVENVTVLPPIACLVALNTTAVRSTVVTPEDGICGLADSS